MTCVDHYWSVKQAIRSHLEEYAVDTDLYKTLDYSSTERDWIERCAPHHTRLVDFVAPVCVIYALVGFNPQMESPVHNVCKIGISPVRKYLEAVASYETKVIYIVTDAVPTPHARLFNSRVNRTQLSRVHILNIYDIHEKVSTIWKRHISRILDTMSQNISFYPLVLEVGSYLWDCDADSV